VLELLPLVGIALLFWLFIIRPASRRQKELGRMQSSLAVGDEIVLTSGVYGSVLALEDDHVMVEIATGVVIKVARGAVGSISTKVDEPAEDQPAGTDDQPGSVPGSEEN
jgi:preprotein translocase subunit YajC